MAVRGVALALVAASACGDNLHQKKPDDGSLPTDTSPSCIVRGGKIVLHKIVYSCKDEASPGAPNCIDGVITLVAAPPKDLRNFEVELHGRIRIIENDQILTRPFLDLTSENGGPVNGTGVTELGLLGLAFHPQYATNRKFYVFYTTDNPDPATNTTYPYLDQLASYTASATDPYVADPTSGVIMISILDPFFNHNGGMIEFGPDGYLYISTGDGGATPQTGSDPFGNAQNPNALLGKILRIDVDHPAAPLTYGIPASNPYATGGGAPEVYILGLRNPWRWSFDSVTGDMWIGDVGLSLYEELDYLPAGHQAGANLGWSKYEALSCFEPPCDPAGMTFPIEVRPHYDNTGPTGWWAIIGGQVYRGSCYPDLWGEYLYTDCGYSNLVLGRRQIDGTLTSSTVPDTTFPNPSSLHSGAGGELYEGDIYGNIWRIEETP